MYLWVAITGTFAFMVQENLVVAGNARETAANILASGGLFNIAILVELVMSVCWILAAYYLYVLFKTTDKNLALLMVLLVSVGAAITCLTTLNKYAAWSLLHGAGYLTAFDDAQMQALALFFLDLSREGLLFNHMFFGGWLFPLGYLVFKSGYFPKLVAIFLSVTLVIGGFGYWTDFAVFLLKPDFGVKLIHYTFWGELFFLLWLLIKRVQAYGMERGASGILFPDGEKDLGLPDSSRI